jgi:hypothetical protein
MKEETNSEFLIGAAASGPAGHHISRMQFFVSLQEPASILMHSCFLLLGVAGKKASRLQDTAEACIYTYALRRSAQMPPSYLLLCIISAHEYFVSSCI